MRAVPLTLIALTAFALTFSFLVFALLEPFEDAGSDRRDAVATLNADA